MNLRTTMFASCMLAFVAGGCGDAPGNPAAESVAREPAAVPTLRLGDDHRYAFSWSVSAEGDASMVGGATVSGDVNLAGELVMRIYDERVDDIVVGVRFARLDTHEVKVMGHNVLPGAESLTKDEAIVRIPRDGRPREVWFSPDTPPVFRKLMEGALAHVDLQLRSPGPFDATGPTGNGLARLRYATSEDNPDVTRRTIDGYERVDAVPGAPADSPWRISGSADIQRGSDAWLDSIHATESLSLVGQETPLQFASQTKFEMRRLGVEHAAATPVPDIAGWVTRDLFEAPDMAEAEQEMARKFAEGLTTTDLIIAVQSAGRGLQPPEGFFIRARGLLRGWPELAGELEPLFADAPDLATRELVIDLLVSADTEQAQEVLADLLAVAPSQELPQLIQHLSLLRHPTPALAQQLLGLEVRAREAGDQTLARAALYPLGSVGAQLRGTDPEVAARVQLSLHEALGRAASGGEARAALAGLGNFADASDLGRVIGQRHHADPDVRMQVGSSLRKMPGERGDDVLFGLLLDADYDVAASALSVIDAYRATPQQTERLAMQVVVAGVHPELGPLLVGVLAKRASEHELAREALGVLLTRAPEGPEKVRIERILGVRS